MPVRWFIFPTTTQCAGNASATPSALEVTALAATAVAEVIVVDAKEKPVNDVQAASVPGWAAASRGSAAGLSLLPPQADSRAATNAVATTTRAGPRVGDAGTVRDRFFMVVSDARGFRSGSRAGGAARRGAGRRRPLGRGFFIPM